MPGARFPVLDDACVLGWWAFCLLLKFSTGLRRLGQTGAWTAWLLWAARAVQGGRSEERCAMSLCTRELGWRGGDICTKRYRKKDKICVSYKQALILTRAEVLCRAASELGDVIRLWTGYLT